MESEGQFVGRICATTSDSEDRDMGSNCSNTSVKRGTKGSEPVVTRDRGAAEIGAGDLSAEILSMKIFRKFLQTVGDGGTGELSQGLFSKLRILKRT